jgi:hypothetical protein
MIEIDHFFDRKVKQITLFFYYLLHKILVLQHAHFIYK